MQKDTDTIEQFRRALRQLEAEIALELSGETVCCGVTVAQCHLLLEAAYRENASLGELADSLETDKSALSRTLDSLVRDGLMNRAENPDNRRKVSVSLTGAGIDKVRSINEICNESYARVFSRIPAAEHATIIESVMTLARAMRETRKEETVSCCNK
jgi:DNA-binding MarR family transcriptional regulator